MNCENVDVTKARDGQEIKIVPLAISSQPLRFLNMVAWGVSRESFHIGKIIDGFVGAKSGLL